MSVVPETKVFQIKPGTRTPNEIQAFLATLRHDSVLAVTASEIQGSLVSQLIYAKTNPKIVAVSPTDGALTVPTALDHVIIVFDEPVSTFTASHFTVFAGGTATAAPTVAATTAGNYGVVLSGVFGTSTTYYQVVVHSTLGFTSGRTLGYEFVTSFRTA